MYKLLKEAYGMFIMIIGFVFICLFFMLPPFFILLPVFLSGCFGTICLIGLVLTIPLGVVLLIRFLDSNNSFPIKIIKYGDSFFDGENR